MRRFALCAQHNEAAPTVTLTFRCKRPISLSFDILDVFYVRVFFLDNHFRCGKHAFCTN